MKQEHTFNVPDPGTFCLLVCCKKLKNQNIQDDNFACGSAWV
jgi:hypothetical protein